MYFLLMIEALTIVLIFYDVSNQSPNSIPKIYNSIQEIFEAIPKLKDNPLVQRVVEVFDEDQSGGVDFKEFVLGNIYLNGSRKKVKKQQNLYYLLLIILVLCNYFRSSPDLCWKQHNTRI